MRDRIARDATFGAPEMRRQPERPYGTGRHQGGAMLRKGQFSQPQAADDGVSPDEAKQWFAQPDVLCLHEYLCIYHGRPSETPERRLMAAVLRDAIESYLRTCRAPNRRKKRNFREVQDWFFRGDDSGVFSLENICGVLNIAPGYIRRILLRYEQQDSAGAEPRADSWLRLAS